MLLNPQTTDDGMFIIAAFRYGLGRMSYAVGCIANVLCRAAPEMRPADRELIIGEIEEAIAQDRAGAEIDVAEWRRVAQAMRVEGERGS